MFRRAVLLLAGLILLPVLSLSAQDEALPVFEPGPCPVQFMNVREVECGAVIVPQDRAHPEEGTLRLAVAIFKSGADAAPDPVLFLDGGPGVRTLDSFTSGLFDLLTQLNRQRDIIAFDYRGIGYSEPALTCPESINAPDHAWVAKCHERYAAQGVDMMDFTTRDNAADAADIIRALGYDSYNIWGGSYGSSVALTLLRDFPQNIRAALVTALQPPQGDLQAAIPAYYQRALDTISEMCQADAACAAAYPLDVTAALAEVVARLNAAPLSLTVQGNPVDFRGDDLILGLGEFLKDETRIPQIPGFVMSLYAGQYDMLEYYANALTQAPDPQNPIGAWMSMRCTDSILLTSAEAMNASLESVNPALREGFMAGYESDLAMCEAWGARVPTEADRQPASVDTPVLIISGALDPYSSQEWLDSTLATLPNGYGFLLPYHAHFVIQNPCASAMLTRFITDPAAEPDAACLAEVAPLAFQLP